MTRRSRADRRAGTGRTAALGLLAFSFVTPIPPADWPVDDRSIFAFHFEALRRAMAEARPDLAAALADRAALGP
jgi:hypothetical protein